MAAALLAVERGAHIVRVHDVQADGRRAEGLRDAMHADDRTIRPAKTTPMSRTYFGTDGIRGTVGQPPDHARLRAAPRPRRRPRAEADERRPTVLIGKDTRISGYMLESALESGFARPASMCVLLGPLPTPGVAYLTRA